MLPRVGAGSGPRHKLLHDVESVLSGDCLSCDRKIFHFRPDIGTYNVAGFRGIVLYTLTKADSISGGSCEN